MFYATVRAVSSRDLMLLAWCIAGSVAAHALLLAMLPRYGDKAAPPVPLTVALRKPPEIELPQPLPMAAQPLPPQRPQAKPESADPVQRQVDLPPPILAASPDASPSPAVVAMPEQKPVPPAPVEPARPPAAALAVVAPPRFDAAYLSNPRPAYPLAARRRGDQGTVLVRVSVTAEGLAASVSLEKSSGHSALDDAALTAVQSWRFVPARQGTQAIAAPYVVPIVFKVE